MEASLIDRATQLLADENLRLTKARRLVLEALTGTAGPVSAAQLDKAMSREVPLSSLYRTLASLETTGVVAKYRDAEGVARFELAEWVTGDHHHHFVCTVCGRTEDVAIPGDLEQSISELIDAVATAGHYTISGHRLELEGVCSTCRQNH